MKYNIKGKFRLGEFYEDFNLIVEAVNEKSALDKVMSQLGSNHHVQRRFIKVEGVSVAKGD